MTHVLVVSLQTKVSFPRSEQEAGVLAVFLCAVQGMFCETVIDYYFCFSPNSKVYLNKGFQNTVL